MLSLDCDYPALYFLHKYSCHYATTVFMSDISDYISHLVSMHKVALGNESFSKAPSDWTLKTVGPVYGAALHHETTSRV